MDAIFAGATPNTLTPLQLLQIIDCIEGFLKVRNAAVGPISLSAQENRPGSVLRETRRDLIGSYVKVMTPKLAAITDKVLKNLFDHKDELVRVKECCIARISCYSNMFVCLRRLN